MNCIPEGTRRVPTWREQHAIDLYAEGHAAPAICRAAGIGKTKLFQILHRHGIVLKADTGYRYLPEVHGWLTDAEMLAPCRGAWQFDRVLTVSEMRTLQAEREAAATIARPGAHHVAA
jgi:hypothetical protein